jgi:hypothetical protein
MSRAGQFCVCALLLSGVASAQSISAAVAATNELASQPLSTPSSAALDSAASNSSSDSTPGENALAWQASIGYSYLRFDLGSGGIPRNYNGISGSISRYADNDGWWGIEGYANLSFGSISSNINRSDGPHAINSVQASESTTRIIFGGGPRFAYRHNKRIEPWVHVILAGEFINFPSVQVQAAAGETLPISHYAGFDFVSGGGIDIKLNRKFAIRGEVDLLSSRLREAWYESVIASGGIVVAF